MRDNALSRQYEQHGYIELPHAVDEPALIELEPVLTRFHERWLRENRQYFEDGVINSAYLTRKGAMPPADRRALFTFVGSHRLRKIISQVLPGPAMFVGTQLFFDPFDPAKPNYWHRDIQYREHTVEQQQALIKTANVLHVRVAFKPERGVELVPGTHRRWDHDDEFDVRMGQNGRAVSDDLSTGVTVPLGRGDALLFSAAMIHRGLYGHQRFALDLLFGDADEGAGEYVPADCLPEPELMAGLDWPEPFAVARKMLGLRD